ncbi:head GIN domain-containing protein [Segetibacter koreensis]|uniref:head GIN domain-containing protein n=1 Tax=Segetibacter koreensis TaxID=398037 RepID=UPI0003645AE3|nr:head GIN domain-containing protein [Segetibacter koreensis]
MKKLLLSLFTFITVCSFAQWETITGNGNVKKETREVTGFTGVALSGNMNVQLAYGTSNTITVEGDENLLPYIETKVQDGVLQVKTKNRTGLKTKSKLMVYVSLTKVTELKVSGSGNITGNGEFTNDGKTNIAVSGSGNINVGMNSFNETKIAVSGSGNVTLKGKSTNNIDATISGSGNIDCSDVACNDVFAHVSGSGNIKVYANRSIDAKVSGSGNIYYKGSATNINLKSSGSGKIIKS